MRLYVARAFGSATVVWGVDVANADAVTPKESEPSLTASVTACGRSNSLTAFSTSGLPY